MQNKIRLENWIFDVVVFGISKFVFDGDFFGKCVGGNLYFPAVFHGSNFFTSGVICGQSLEGSHTWGPPVFQILLPYQISSRDLL